MSIPIATAATTTSAVNTITHVQKPASAASRRANTTAETTTTMAIAIHSTRLEWPASVRGMGSTLGRRQPGDIVPSG